MKFFESLEGGENMYRWGNFGDFGEEERAFDLFCVKEFLFGKG